MELGSLADWLAAVGTIFAAVTALWLARQESRPRIWVYSSMWDRSILKVKIQNSGYLPVSVSGVLLFTNVRGSFALGGGSLDEAEHPPLAHGDSVEFIFSLSEVHARAQEQFRKSRVAWLKRRLPSPVRVRIFLSSAESRDVPLYRPAQQVLRQEVLPADILPFDASSSPPVVKRVAVGVRTA